MFSSIRGQAALFLLQCMLIVWVFSGPDGSHDGQTAPVGLIALDVNRITEITISDDTGNKVVLKKRGDTWILPDYYKLAVNRGLLDELLERLTTAKTAWPLAQTESAAERFSVSKTKFKRHLLFQSETGPEFALYLGDSPGLRKIYVRKQSAADIYAIELGLHLVPATADQWFDNGLLKVSGEINEIQAADFHLYKKEGGWSLKDLPGDEVLDQEKAIYIENYLKYPQLQGVAAQDLLGKITGEEPDMHYRVHTADAELNYEFYRVDEQVVLKSSQSELYFTVSGSIANNLVGVIHNSLIKKDGS